MGSDIIMSCVCPRNRRRKEGRGAADVFLDAMTSGATAIVLSSCYVRLVSRFPEESGGSTRRLAGAVRRSRISVLWDYQFFIRH
jgi:hypothetical protein